MTLVLLPVGQRDDAADRYLAQLAPATQQRVRVQLEQLARWLLGMPDAPRLGAAGFAGRRRLHLALDRVPWSACTVDDAQRVREAALGGPRSRRTVASMFGALRGVLRAAGVLTLAHIDVLRVNAQGEGAG